MAPSSRLHEFHEARFFCMIISARKISLKAVGKQPERAAARTCAVQLMYHGRRKEIRRCARKKQRDPEEEGKITKRAQHAFGHDHTQSEHTHKGMLLWDSQDLERIIDTLLLCAAGKSDCFARKKSFASLA
jgi:hypothetical protein